MLKAAEAAAESVAALDTFYDQSTLARDLMADIMHWCDANEIDFDAELAVARDNYEAEREE